MKTLIALLLAATLTGCTITPFVRSVEKDAATGQTTVEQCELTVYLALYGLVARATDCTKTAL